MHQFYEKFRVFGVRPYVLWSYQNTDLWHAIMINSQVAKKTFENHIEHSNMGINIFFKYEAFSYMETKEMYYGVGYDEFSLS